jgi:hypothetical protein
MVVVTARHTTSSIRAFVGIAVVSLLGCSGSEGFSRLDAGLPLGSGNSDGNPDGLGGGAPRSTGGAPGSGGMAMSTGGRGAGGSGNGGTIATGGASGTGGSPATGGTLGSGGTPASGGRTASGGGGAGSGGRSGGGGVGGPATGGAAGGSSSGGAAGGQTGSMGGSTGTRPCDGLCLNAIEVAPKKISGNLGTATSCNEVIPTAAVSIIGLNCGNFVAPRTFSVNATPLDCAASNNKNFPLPAQRNGGYCMQASAGNNSFAYFITY